MKFILIGVQKSGTTAIGDMLEQHPQINLQPERDTGWNDPDATGMLDNRYFPQWRLHRPRTPAGTRIIGILRNPADRAFSDYLHRVRRGTSRNVSFEDAIRIRPDNPMDRIIDLGFYAESIEAWRHEHACLWLLHDDLAISPDLVWNRIQGFLGLDFHDVRFRTRNAGGRPKNTLWQSAVNRLEVGDYALKRFGRRMLPTSVYRWCILLVDRMKSPNLEREFVRPETRQKLIETYRSDILRTDRLIRRDLGGWLR